MKRVLDMPQPAPGFVAGCFRVSVLSPTLLRIERSATSIFEDRLSLAVSDRRPIPARFLDKRIKRGLHLDSERFRLRLLDGNGPFAANNLRVDFRQGRTWRLWTPGLEDKGNLGGTLRTLDGCDGLEKVERREVRVDPGSPEGGAAAWGWRVEETRQPVPMGTGFLSREGWSLLDDSRTPVLDPRWSPDGAAERGDWDVNAKALRVRAARKFPEGWATARDPHHEVDVYLFLAAGEPQTVLADAARLVGSQPLPPRWVFGLWSSRDGTFAEPESLRLIEDFESRGIPLDVLVLDMDWHKPGWTGYTWDRRLFPDPAAFLRRVKGKGIRVSLNLHPAEGVSPHEEAYAAVRRDLGLPNTKRVEDPAPVPFDCTDPAYMRAYFDRLLHPHEDKGVDFWWLDWQQGETCALPGLDPLPWLNRLHFLDARRRGRPNLIFSRYGGHGSGKYPIGFSGDTYATWNSLQSLPRVTAQAANVLYGYWSHDIGGFMETAGDAELYLRWVQFGAVSPVLRLHGGRLPENERRFWRWPQPWSDLLVEAARERRRMVPYLFGEARRCADGAKVGAGIVTVQGDNAAQAAQAAEHRAEPRCDTPPTSLCTPMYHSWPSFEDAYLAHEQYRFGSAYVAAPVVTPADRLTGLAARRFWLPPGSWWDVSRGERFEVPRRGGWFTRHFLAGEVPLFARPGTLVPKLGLRTGTSAALPEGGWTQLTLEIHPGSDGRLRVYENDGSPDAMESGREAWWPVVYREKAIRERASRGKASLAQSATQTGGLTRCELVFEPLQGAYPGRLHRRSVDVCVWPCPPPRPGSLRLGEAVLAHMSHLPEGDSEGVGWCYNASRTELRIRLGKIDCRKPVHVAWSYLPMSPKALQGMHGFRGSMPRLHRLAEWIHPANIPMNAFFDRDRFLGETLCTAVRIEDDPRCAETEWSSFPKRLLELQQVLAEYHRAYRTDTDQLPVGLRKHARAPRFEWFEAAEAFLRQCLEDEK